MKTGISPRHWTPDEIAVLRELYPYMRAADIAARLGRTRTMVLAKAWNIGLRKTKEAISQMTAMAMADPNHPARLSRFAPGAAPWNKGMAYEAGGRSVETRFKAGQVAVNWSPIGTERIRTDGYMERKMTDTGVTRRDFVLVHHLVWQAAGRDIPAGHVLIFRDGNKRNFDIDNLETISRSDLMRRNSLHNYGPEVAAIYQLQGAIARQINKQKRKSP
ncbi:MAG: HNH endonuclease [Azonexus sp.]|nr:HNH endonuclease [Azonexus sp.]